jgi:hypothetical protein
VERRGIGHRGERRGIGHRGVRRGSCYGIVQCGTRWRVRLHRSGLVEQ